MIVEHDFSTDVALHNTTRWGRTHQDYLLTSFRGDTANLLTPDPADPSTWTIARSLPTFKDQTNRILTNQTNVTANFETGGIAHNLSAGIELTREKAGTIGLAALNGSAWPAANLYHPNADVGGLVSGRTGAHSEGQTDTAAAYLFDTLKFNEQWQVNAGMRLDHYTTDFSSMVVCGARNGPACGALPAGQRAARRGQQQIRQPAQLQARRAVQAGRQRQHLCELRRVAGTAGRQHAQLSSAANSADNPNLDPQKARTVEVGTKWDLLGEKLLLTGALYRTTVSNELVQDPVDLQYYQIGRKRVQGIELSAVGKLSDNWAVSAGYTIMDAKVIHGTCGGQRRFQRPGLYAEERVHRLDHLPPAVQPHPRRRRPLRRRDEARHRWRRSARPRSPSRTGCSTRWPAIRSTSTSTCS